MRGRYLSLGMLLLAAGCGGGGNGDDDDDPDQLAVAALKLAACTGQSPERVAALSFPRFSDGDIACIAAADDCDAALACVGMRYGTECSPDDSCADGQTLLSCSGNLPLAIDCAAADGRGGPSCLTGDDGEATCGVAACDVPAESCDGAVRIECEGGVRTEVDCSELGVSCSDTGTGSECSTRTETSCTDGAARCEGDIGVGCEGGVETLTDCSEFIPGGTCLVDGAGDAFCGYGTECDVDLGSPSDRCEGDALRFCLLGVSVAVDCGDVGLTTCTTDALGTGCR